MAIGVPSDAIGSVALKLVPDMSGFAQGVGSQMQRMGGVLTAAITGPLALLGNKAVGVAAAVGELENAVVVSLGNVGETVIASSRTAIDTLGLSRKSYLETAMALGGMGKAAGLAGEDLNQFIQKGIARAVDLSSVYDVDVTEAVQKMGSAFRGESEPIRAFNVFLNEQAVAAKAAELGLVAANGQVSEQAKVLARSALVMEQTNVVAGDYANTQDSLSNSQRKTSQEAENLATAFGEKLVPIKAKMIELASQIIDRFNSLSPTTQDNILKMLGLAAAIGPVLLVGGSMIKMIGTVSTAVKGLSVAMAFLAANPIVLVIAAIAALVAGLVIAYQRSETFRNIVNGVFRAVASVVTTKLDEIKAGLETAIGVVKIFWRAFQTARRIIGDAVQALVNRITGPLRTAVDLLERLNPWSRRSPSLVEQVESGLRAIERAYARVQLAVPQPQLAAGGVTNVTVHGVNAQAIADRVVERLTFARLMGGGLS